MEQAVRQGQYEDVAAFAHWLKGSGGTVGFDDFTEPASKLETLAKSGGSDAEVLAVINNLHALAARLVIPGKGSTRPSVAAMAPSAKEVAKAPLAQPPSVARPAKPLTSRLADNPKFHRVIGQFVEKLKAELKRAEQVFEEEDMAELALIAHWLKGAGGTVGFDELTSPATKLEAFAKTAQVEQAGRMLQQLMIMSEAIVPPTLVQTSMSAPRSIENRQVAS